MRAATPALPVTDAQRFDAGEADSFAHRTAPRRDVQRARVLLMAGDGFANARIAAEVQVSPAAVTSWRERFEEAGLKDFSAVRPDRGRKPSIPARQDRGDRALDADRDPARETHWSCRTMAERAGVSSSTVQRIWSARDLQPHRVRTFKLSGDPDFEEKLVDVVGVYLSPPENAIVLCMDEKSQIQAVDRTQPSLPIKPGRAGPMTDDYERNRTTTLFAALDVLTVRRRDRPMPATSRPRRMPHVPQNDRPPGPQAAEGAPDPRRRRHPQPPQGQSLARASPPNRAALHPDLQLLAGTWSSRSSARSLTKRSAAGSSTPPPT